MAKKTKKQVGPLRIDPYPLIKKGIESFIIRNQVGADLRFFKGDKSAVNHRIFGLLDKSKINKMIGEYSRIALERNMSVKDGLNYVQENVTDYISHRGSLTKEGEEKIFGVRDSYDGMHQKTGNEFKYPQSSIKKMNKKKINIDEIIHSAVGEGIDAIVGEHPRFSGSEKYFAKNVDGRKLRTKIGYIGKNLGGRSDEEFFEYLQDEIRDYIATGEAFNDRGKKVLLEQGRLEKESQRPGIFNWLKRKVAKSELEGLKYLDKTLESSNRIYELFEAGGGYGMPEFEKPLNYIRGSGFRQVLLEELREDGTINDSTYRKMNQDLRKSIKGARRELAGGLEKYSAYEPHQKVAAAVLGISGVGLLLMFGNGMTGGVIGVTDNNIVATILGGMFIVSSLILFFKSSLGK